MLPAWSASLAAPRSASLAARMVRGPPHLLPACFLRCAKARFFTHSSHQGLTLYCCKLILKAILEDIYQMSSFKLDQALSAWVSTRLNSFQLATLHCTSSRPKPFNPSTIQVPSGDHVSGIRKKRTAPAAAAAHVRRAG
jgi:hypothetical protein